MSILVWCGISMLSAISGTRYILRFKAKIFFALVFLSLTSFSHHGFAGVYNSPPSTNPIYRCTTGIGCCSPGGVPTIVSHAFLGGGGFVGSDLQQSYYMNSLWPRVETALKMLTDEFRKVIIFSTVAQGAMIDAQTLMQTLTSLQKQTTSSLISQTPSDQICRFGTLSRSLAQSDDKTRVVQMGLSSQMMKRQLMQKNMASEFEDEVGSKLGRTSDKISRFDQYKKSYCDPKDSDGTLGAGWCTATTDTRRNKDIEITRSLYSPLTLNLDFSSDAKNGDMTVDEQNIIALANNLFAHDLPINMEKVDFKTMMANSDNISESRKELVMDYRSLTAKRNIAQNSFAALAAMKADGSAGASTYLKAMVAELGLDASNQDALLGQNPSYNAQMELLTRKIYQSPKFYANLMESNPNVARQQTAMEAIGLMQDRDIHESLRRTEMALSTLLEMQVMRDQKAFQDRGVK